MARFVKVATTDEMAPGQAKMVQVDDKKIALFQVEGGFYALDDTCTHRGDPFPRGRLRGSR